MALATVLSRFRADLIMGALWAMQACIAFGSYIGLLVRPKRADRVMRVAFCFLFVTMVARVARAVTANRLQDVDRHAASIGIVLGLLTVQTLFSPEAARRINLACATIIFAVLLISFAWMDHPTLDDALFELRLMAATVMLVSLVSFVNDTGRQYGRLWEEHRLMQTLALCDPLTELPNRRACESTLRREIARSEREGKPLSLILLDVDHFKAVNDCSGHEAGDQVLLRVAQLLRDNVRASDAPARWAGDEFVAVLPATTLEQGELVAERIRRAVADAKIGCGQTTCTVTLGVAQLLVGSDDIVSLLARADRNLYRAKRDGRNRSVAA